jgi:hypothetical protein
MWLLGVAVVSSLALAACGDGGDDSSSQAQTPTPASITPSATPPTASSAPNSAPLIAGTPATTAVQGQRYSFVPDATDADDDPLTFSIANRPSWAAFDASTGELAGVPTPGTYSNIVITVSDSQANVSLAPFTIAVQTGASSNSPPTISGNAGTTARQGQPYAFTPTASDREGNRLTFSITNRPTWATFSTTTGRLSGTPGASNVRTYGNIVIRVSDGQATASLPAFSIVVAPATSGGGGNTPPTISGNPLTSVVAGVAYSFRPTANDADGNGLTFAVSGLPGWAAFSTANGRISGTPSVANVGASGNIAITVSDGLAATTLAPFSITVLGVATGSATLAWTPPTQNSDGSPLIDLAGYKVSWGSSEDDYSNSVSLDNPGLTSYVVEQLTPGTWYFAMKAVNAKGVESGDSNVASKAVQ